MKTVTNASRVLGIAFLLQFITSFSDGVFFKPALIVPGNIGETVARIANNAGLMRTYIFLDMLTALGIIFLSAVLYLALRKQNEKMALVGFGFYILEAVILVVCRLNAFSLLRISQEYVTAGQPPYLLTMASLALESMDFGSTLFMLAFCPGAALFYYLLYRSGLVPPVLSLWGLVALFPLMIAVLLSAFGGQFPMLLALPYVPFEFAIGIWILVKGVREDVELATQRA